MKRKKEEEEYMNEMMKQQQALLVSASGSGEGGWLDKILPGLVTTTELQSHDPKKFLSREPEDISCAFPLSPCLP